MSATEKPATWRVVVAFILDLAFSFFLIGYAIAMIFGGTTEDGFSLSGLPAVILFALWIAYMVGMPRLGGRVFQRIFGVV